MGKSILRQLAALALCAALTGGTALAANTVYRTITVQYSGIKLVVDGVEVTPQDANGTTVEPVHLQRHHLSAGARGGRSDRQAGDVGRREPDRVSGRSAGQPDVAAGRLPAV